VVRSRRPRSRRGDREWLQRPLYTAAALIVCLVAIHAAVDPLLEQQWHLKSRSVETAGANVQPEWATTKGAGVVIGIVGDGLEGTHPDLQPNYLPGSSFDFNSNDNDPTPSATDSRGTAAAGVSAARDDNGIGGAGAAPRASLAGLRLTAAPATDQQEADAFGYLPDGIQIQSHAWNRPDDGVTVKGPGPLAAAALQSAATTGRSGKGRVFVFGVGDGRASGDDCNFDGYANSRFAIAVGAVTDAGQLAPYSEFCSAVLVSAPSSGGGRGITTTDLVGNSGASTGDYTDTFGGTAAAASTVSGAVALMLARNPNLTARDVQHILRRSSFRLNPSDSSWTVGAYPHSEKYGFGLLDAQSAATMAASWTNVPAEASLAPATRTLNLAVPDNDPSGLTDSITISSAEAGFVVERVEVEFTAAHSWRGDLHVTLTSPSGVVSTLAPSRPSDSNDNFSAWKFTTVRHWGEGPVGAWTLRVSDRITFFTGSWTSWTIKLYGYRTPEPAPTISSLESTNVTLTSASLHAVVNPNGSSTSSTFQFGPTQSYGDVVAGSPANISGPTAVAVNAMISGLTCGTQYNFRTVATNAGGSTVSANASFSTLACPLSGIFSDDPVVAGVTVVRAIHITELRQRIDAVRTRCGLGVYGWVDATPVIVRAVHVTDLRTALSQAYVSCGRTVPAFTDTTLVPTVTMAKAIHINELRNAVKAIE
jgi:subtilisin-like proprotein convertase family protein